MNESYAFALSESVTSFPEAPSNVLGEGRGTGVLGCDRYRQPEGRARGDTESRALLHAIANQLVHAVLGRRTPKDHTGRRTPRSRTHSVVTGNRPGSINGLTHVHICATGRLRQLHLQIWTPDCPPKCHGPHVACRWGHQSPPTGRSAGHPWSGY